REVVLRNFRQPNTVEVIEGYARTDALNRIGNRVFAIDANRFDNYAAVDAPVNYPHIWTTSWFKWVQYDASIMQPLFRNLGEALGVYANVGLDAPSEEGRFFSAVPLENLVWLEDWLKGPQNPSIDQEFNGLLAPDWPDQFPPINMTRAAQGEVLYKEMCVRCHLPPINGQLTDNLGQPVNEPDFFEDTIWNHFEPIQWWVGDQPQPESEPVLNLRVIPIDVVGTDPATGEVLATRKVNSAGFAGGVTAESTLGMEIDELVCAWEPQAPESPWESMGQAGSPSPNQPLTDGASAGAQPQPRLVGTRVSDNPNGLYSLLLGSLVQAVANQWFLKNDYPDEVKLQMMGNRPNCFQAGKGYKARPHDGIWATAPFLHNGSVPTLWDLLSPVEDRPKYVLLGDIEFDVEKVGLVQPENFQPRSGNKYDRSGYFVLDTSIPGNLNIGHEFRGDGSGGKGVIGRGLSDAERMDLIEYLKTL
ncbi:MAG: di-heme-cytochrome C peroxidase, partial [Gammaproteobacteria bacterium]